MYLSNFIDALGEIGNRHGFDTTVEIVVEDQACGIVIKKERTDEMGNKVMIRVGSVDVPLQSQRVIDDV